MPRKGENIYKRKDGRWEGRYIRSYDASNKAKYSYVYGKTYSEVKQKLIDRRSIVKRYEFDVWVACFQIEYSLSCESVKA